MNTSLREAAARELVGLSREQVVQVLAFMAGMEAESRLSAQAEREGERPQQSAGICPQGQNFVHNTVDFFLTK